MFFLNLRQKMIACFCLHLVFYIVVGVTFIKDFGMFNDDVTLLMHAGNLSNISLEIRRYEKNFIIRHDNNDFIKVLAYIDEAQQFVPQVIDDLKIMPQPTHLEDLTAKLTAYEENFYKFKEQCTSGEDIICPSREKVRTLGQDLVTITEDLVLFEQNKMTSFIEKFTSRLINAILFLIILSIFTITLLYTSIVKPLKMVENAAMNVANGTFTLLPVAGRKGEVYSVLRAFNKMVTDLEEQQEQLFQAKKLSSIGTLASGTAHQINNPLNNISTSCQLALADIGDKDKDSFVVKMLETINQETQRAGEIVRGLLEFSRVQTFSPQPYQLAEIITKVKRLVASEVPTGTTIKTNIPEDMLLYVDIQKMVEALLNLTINAIQAIVQQPGTVFIRAEKDTEKMAMITISDTGTGIEQQDLAKIFDPFFTTKNAENGTGLGLAVVYGIIKKQNGTIRVESVKGSGTSFIITLPIYSEYDKTGLLSKSSISRVTNV